VTRKLRALVDALDDELRDVSRDPDADLHGMEMQLRVWLDDTITVRQAQARRAERRCHCGRTLETDGSCRAGCIQ
jgi:hypothetical protein